MKRLFLLLFVLLTLALITACLGPSPDLEADGSCLITFYTDNGGKVNPIRLQPGETVTLPTQPLKDGFSFRGWFTERNGGGTELKNGDVVRESMSVYAYWVKASAFTLTFYDYLTNRDYVVDYHEDHVPAFPADPEEEGWFFRGWYTEQLGLGTKVESFEGITEDLTLYAFWEVDLEKNPIERHTVHFDAQGGVGETPPLENVMVGERVRFPALTNGILVLTGWYTQPNGQGKLYTTDSPIYDDVTLYAFWELPRYDIDFAVGEDVSAVVSITKVTHGTTVELPIPVREGYLFDGWYDHALYPSVLYTNETPILKDVTLSAHWIPDPNYVGSDGQPSDGQPSDGQSSDGQLSDGQTPDVPVNSDGTPVDSDGQQ